MLPVFGRPCLGPNPTRRHRNAGWSQQKMIMGNRGTYRPFTYRAYIRTSYLFLRRDGSIANEYRVPAYLVGTPRIAPG
jgi:hypothetical protein